ncbi:MAG TPA: NAD(P)/FAD-dependent oxidoreductase [Steroidobacteraceae bacterium]|nr:NAD(P)/FAD-dependent oxidoreductase [Steroidobacteraceae bacterium]
MRPVSGVACAGRTGQDGDGGRLKSGGAVLEVVIVGAGPAGLAAGACLRRLGMSPLILEQAGHFGAAWHGHYDRLRLHTNRGLSALPFLAFSRDCPRYPSRLEVISYLQEYARRFQLTPRFNQQVISVRRASEVWQVDTHDERYEAAALVIASGFNRKPRVPTWPGQEAYRGRLLHSSQYRNGTSFRGRSVLVVGFGNSAGEIAVDLSEHGARVALAVRGAVHVLPREILGLPVVAIALAQAALPARVADALNAGLLRVAVGDLGRYGLHKPARGPRAQIELDARIPLIDVGTVALIKRGEIAVHPGIARFSEEGVVFADGRAERFDAVILATGYQPRVDEFVTGAAAALDARGAPLSSGCESALPGLYFCGFRVTATGMLREIAREARRLSLAIARKAQSQVSAADPRPLH